MQTLLSALLLAAASTGPVPLDPVAQTRLDPDLRCLLGVYALPAGRSMTITGSGGQTRGLEYTLSDGRFGTLTEGAKRSYSAPSVTVDFEPCEVGTLSLTRDQVVEPGIRLRLSETRTAFTSDGVSLQGKLVTPADGRAESLAVWIEGSNNNPATDDAVWPYELARRGVAVFVYDKRGTGASGGAPTSDFHARARDSAAAVQAALRLAPGAQRVGVIGASQGGWVAPLTATLVPLDFVVAAFAMAEGPIAQDQALVMQALGSAGFDGEALDQARELTAITERIVRSNMQAGLDDLDAFKIRYASAPWFVAIQPRSYTGIFLKSSSEEIRTHGPALAQGLSFDYEPRPVIESIKPRQLWLLGGRDRQAPNLATQAILGQIQRQRSAVGVVIFPDADHGLIESRPTAVGVSKAYSARLFDVAADWIKDQKLPGPGIFIRMPTAD